MQDGLMVGNDLFTPVVELFDPLYGHRQLYQALLDSSIRDVKKRKRVRDAALFWVNDRDAHGVTSFNEVCSFLGKNQQHYREMINRYAACCEHFHRNLLGKGNRKKRPGRKKEKICQMQGCNEKTAGRFCERCKRIYYSRRNTYRSRPELWILPRQPAGQNGTLIEVYQRMQATEGQCHEKTSL